MNSFGIFTAPMVKELMFHSITNHQFDANFTEKAIKSLVKRLRQSKELGCIEKLRKAITTKVAFSEWVNSNVNDSFSFSVASKYLSE